MTDETQPTAADVISAVISEGPRGSIGPTVAQAVIDALVNAGFQIVPPPPPPQP